MVRRREPTVPAELQHAPAVRPRGEQLAIHLLVRQAESRYEPQPVSPPELLRDAESGREALDPVVSRQVESVAKLRLLRRPPGLQREVERLQQLVAVGHAEDLLAWLVDGFGQVG